MAQNNYFKNVDPVATDYGQLVRLIPGTTPFPVTSSPLVSSAAAETYPALTGASQTLLAANANRKGVVIVNDSGNTLYVKFGAVASATSYTYKLVPNQQLEIGQYGVLWQGQIDAFSSAASGNAAVSELT